MGMNYYTKINNCEACGRHDEVHLGKSSAGWQFSFQYNGGKFYKDINGMRAWLEDKEIRDEGGRVMSHAEFWEMVEAKKGGMNHADQTKDISSFNLGGYSFTDAEFS